MATAVAKGQLGNAGNEPCECPGVKPRHAAAQFRTVHFLPDRIRKEEQYPRTPSFPIFLAIHSLNRLARKMHDFGAEEKHFFCTEGGSCWFYPARLASRS